MASDKEIEAACRRMLAASRPTANPDDLTPPPRGQAGMTPKWRLYEHLAVAALAVQPREWIDPKNWPDATSVPVKESLTTQRAATCQESLQAQSANSPEIPDGWKDAEIARLRDALQGIADCAMSGSMFEELALDALFADPTKDK